MTGYLENIGFILAIVCAALQFLILWSVDVDRCGVNSTDDIVEKVRNFFAVALVERGGYFADDGGEITLHRVNLEHLIILTSSMRVIMKVIMAVMNEADAANTVTASMMKTLDTVSITDHNRSLPVITG